MTSDYPHLIQCMSFIITGNPGVGKHTITKEISKLLDLEIIDINKIANDLRLLSSGPKTGLNEIVLPTVEPGSSIMPGKINPSWRRACIYPLAARLRSGQIFPGLPGKNQYFC